MPVNRPFTSPDRRDRIKRCFFVDYENVHEAGLSGLMKLEKTDHVTIFYSKFVNTMTFELHRALNDTKAQVELISVQAGTKNALDFQLSTNLGYRINYDIVAKNKDAKYYIVSNDQGYCCLGPFWEQFGATVSVVTSIRSVVDPTDMSAYELAFRELGLTEQEEKEVVALLDAGMTGSPLHDALQRNIKPAARASEIYRKLKTVIMKQARTRAKNVASTD